MKREFAVLVGIYNNTIVLTKRAANLRSFAGHVCFPGGMIEAGDLSATEAAIREFGEELQFEGIIKPVFCLERVYSPTANSVVYPIVARLDGKIGGFNISEVERIIYLPLIKLEHGLFVVNPDFPNIRHNWCFNYEVDFIWGLTAYILKNFCEYKKNLI